MIKRLVFSGGPCSGKTTIIDEFEKQGFKVFHEVARQLEEEIKNKRLDESMQYKLFRLQYKQNKEADKFETVFFDRGIPDSLSYFKYHNWKIPEEVIKNSLPEKTKYNLVFIFEMLPFIKDGFRFEKDENEAKRIHELIYKTYKSLGYKTIEVPVTSLEERVKFVKKFIF